MWKWTNQWSCELSNVSSAIETKSLDFSIINRPHMNFSWQYWQHLTSFKALISSLVSGTLVAPKKRMTRWSLVTLFTVCPPAAILLLLDSPFLLTSTSSSGFSPFKGGLWRPERVSYTLAWTRGRRAGEIDNISYYISPFCPPHSRPILHPLKSLPLFLFELFPVSADFPFIHLASSQATCDPWPGSILYSLSPLSAAKALTYKEQGRERWTRK